MRAFRVFIVFVVALLLPAACASSRVRDQQDEADAFDIGTDAADASSDAATDGSTAPADAATTGACTTELERIADWPLPLGGLQAPPALAVGPAGEIVAAFNHEEVYLAVARRISSGVWSTSSIGELSGSFPTLAFWSDGTLRACYVHAAPHNRGPLVCGSQSPGAAWTTQVIDENPNVMPSLALDPIGIIHVAYGRPDSVGRAESSSGVGWSLTPLPVGTVGATSLAYDAERRAHLVWTVHANSTGSLFHGETGLVDADDAWVTPRSLAVDAAGREHLVYVSHASERLTYAVRDPGGAWQFERDLDGDGVVPPWSVALALGADGRVHVTYYHRPPALQGPDHVRHAVRAPGGGWTTEDLLDAPTYYPSVTSVVAATDGVHIAFDALTPGSPPLRTVYYARRCGAADPL